MQYALASSSITHNITVTHQPDADSVVNPGGVVNLEAASVVNAIAQQLLPRVAEKPPLKN